MGRGRKRGAGTPVWVRRVLLVGALGTAFVVGVLVGQHAPRPISEVFVANVLDEPEDHERMAAPSADRVLTFYDTLPQPADAVVGERDEVSTRVLPRTPEPQAVAEPPATVRTLSRQSATAADDEGGAATPEPEGQARARTLSRTAEPEPTGEALARTAAAAVPQQGALEDASEPAGAPEESRERVDSGSSGERAAGSGEAEAAPRTEAAAGEADGGGEQAALETASADSEPRRLARAPVQANNALEGEVASAGTWEEAQAIRQRLSEAGVETAVITVEEPGLGRRVAVLVRPGGDMESRVAAARTILATR